MTPFAFLNETFKKEDVPFLIQGDYARYHYDKSIRVTPFIEVLIPDNFLSKTLLLLEKKSWYSCFFGENFVRFHNENFTFLELDILHVEQDRFEKLFSNASQAEIANVTFYIPSLQALLHPITKKPEVSRTSFSMDDYVNFIEFCLKHTIDQKTLDCKRREMIVGERFRLK